jgi:hypothetical protein
MLLRSASSDEDGDNPANIAASGASNEIQRDARAALNSCERRESRAAARRRREMQAFFLCERRRSRRIQSAMREQL